MIEKQKKRDLTKLCVEVFFPFKKIKFSSTFGFFRSSFGCGKINESTVSEEEWTFSHSFYVLRTLICF